MSMMTIRDLEQVQTAFSEAGLDYQLELENGKISIISPSELWPPIFTEEETQIQ